MGAHLSTAGAAPSEQDDGRGLFDQCSRLTPDEGTGSLLHMRVEVHDNQIESALKTLKKGMLKDGLFKEMKKRAYYEKPSVKRKRKQAEARNKRRKAMKRTEQDD